METLFKKFFLVASITGLVLFSGFARAQTTPDFYVTWRSGAYTESGYQGKVLPVAGAPITIAFELIDGGKFANLSRTTIRWMKNGRLFQSGVGLQTVTIPTDPIIDRGEIRIKIVIAQYKGVDIQRNFILPVVAPEIVIRAPYPNRLMPSGTQTIRALFYNWSAAQAGTLAAEWTMQGERLTTTGKDNVVTLNLPRTAAGQLLLISVAAKNLANDFETANASQTFTITP